MAQKCLESPKCVFFVLLWFNSQFNFDFCLDGLNDDFEKSHDLFRNAFCDGFPWEVLKVLSGPPNVMCTWRHWGKFPGTFRGRQGTGEIIELFGVLRVTVNKDLKIQKIEAYYDAESFLAALEGKHPPEKLRNGRMLLGETNKAFVDIMKDLNQN